MKRTDTAADDTAPPVSSRRVALSALGGLGALALWAARGSGAAVAATGAAVDASTEAALDKMLATTPAACLAVAEEVEGPYPLRAILSNRALQRSDMTEGKTGVALALRIKLVDINNACAPIAGASVYLWHCDKDGRYSGYEANAQAGQAGQTYLRGVQVSDADGGVTFKTIVPGWYAGRITHMHAMVFLAGSSLGSASTATATTQFAFPPAAMSEVYDSPLYKARGQNRSVASFADDSIFSDGTGTEMVAMAGSASDGYLGAIVVGVDPTHTSSGRGGRRPPRPLI